MKTQQLKQSLSSFYYSLSLQSLRLMNNKFSNLNLTYNSVLYLDLISFMNGKCTATQIADLLYVSRPAVTKKIRELMKAGFVVRQEDPSDARRYFLSINEEKLPIFAIYRNLDKEAVERIAERYSEEDVAKFCEMLDVYTQSNADGDEKMRNS